MKQDTLAIRELIKQIEWPRTIEYLDPPKRTIGYGCFGPSSAPPWARDH